MCNTVDVAIPLADPQRHRHVPASAELHQPRKSIVYTHAPHVHPCNSITYNATAPCKGGWVPGLLMQTQAPTAC